MSTYGYDTVNMYHPPSSFFFKLLLSDSMFLYYFLSVPTLHPLPVHSVLNRESCKNHKMSQMSKRFTDQSPWPVKVFRPQGGAVVLIN